jgi:hypothetical protein
MSRVFIPEMNPRYDVSQAEAWGEIVPLVERVNALDPTSSVIQFQEALTKLQFDPQKDWLLMSGHMLACSTAMLAVFDLYGYVPVLLFNSTTSKYVQRVVDHKEEAATEEG